MLNCLLLHSVLTSTGYCFNLLMTLTKALLQGSYISPLMSSKVTMIKVYLSLISMAEVLRSNLCDCQAPSRSQITCHWTILTSTL